MICSYISGRLGNQFFEYAYARALQIARGEKDGLCFNFELVKGAGNAGQGFEDSLKYFKVNQYHVSDKNLVLVFGTFFQKIIYLLYQITNKLHIKLPWGPFLHRNGLLFYNYEEEPELIIPKSANIVTYGKFGNPNVFESIKGIIRDEFTPLVDPLNSNQSLYQVIRDTESVCISIRRGDFLSKKFKDDFLVCDKSYFLSAIIEIKKRIANPTFIFFSDDIDWVKDNIKVEAPCYYESGNDPVWEKLRLMYSCKHFIISNSTFSWWAQYLSRNEQKIVVSPRRWMNNTSKHFNLLNDSFIKI